MTSAFSINMVLEKGNSILYFHFIFFVFFYKYDDKETLAHYAGVRCSNPACFSYFASLKEGKQLCLVFFIFVWNKIFFLIWDKQLC